MSQIVAFAWASGLIEFGKKCPDGALPILIGDKAKVTEIVTVLARHSYTPGKLLVPGISEATDAQESLKALTRFTKRAKEYFDKEK